MYHRLAEKINKGEIAPIYVLYGKNQYHINKVVSLLKEKVAPGGNDAINIEKFDGNVNSANEVASACNTYPFFSDKKLVICENASWFCNKTKKTATNEGESEEEKPQEENKEAPKVKEDTDELLNYLSNPLDTTVVIFLPGESLSKSKKLVKMADRNGEVCEFQEYKNAMAENWLTEMFKRQGKDIESSAVRYIISCAENNMEQMENEVEKLVLYKKTGKITLEDAENICTSSANINVFNLIDAVARGDVEKSLHLLRQFAINNSVDMVIAMLVNHFRFLIICKDLHSLGYNANDISKQTGKHSFVVEKSLGQCNRYTMKQLHTCLKILLQAEFKHKTGVCDNLSALETGIIQICTMKDARKRH